MKKWFGFLGIIVILVGSLVFFLKPKEKVLDVKQIKKDYLNEIVNYDFGNARIDSKFLNWFLIIHIYQQLNIIL